MRFALPLRCAALALILAAVWPDHAGAQAYPNRPIRLIVPFPPGGAADILARLIGNKVAEQIGQPLVVENRPGAGGTLGADAAAKSPPDGYTILHNTNGAAIAPALYRILPFDGVKDFAPVTQIVASNLVLVAGPKSGIESLKDLLARARANPGKLNYGSSGPGNPLHLTMEMLKHAAGVDIVAVPFRGDGHIHTALIAGEVEVAVIPLAAAVPLIQEGRLKALAVTGPKRSSRWPMCRRSPRPQTFRASPPPDGRAGSCRQRRPRRSSRASATKSPEPSPCRRSTNGSAAWPMSRWAARPATSTLTSGPRW